ncbi:helicase HerA-like domain-containing protein, partial [Propionivibrio sp.]
PAFDAAAAITELGVGEALVSFLDEKGRPNVVERAFIMPPASRIGPLTAEERQGVIKGSLVYGVYETVLDRESAYEKLKNKQAGETAPTPAANAAPAPAPAQSNAPASGGGWLGGLGDLIGGSSGSGGRNKGGDSMIEMAAKSAARTIGSQVGREIIRGVLGSILGGSRRR